MGANVWILTYIGVTFMNIINDNKFIFLQTLFLSHK